jgi:aromatic ring-opening dioxygenase catalytic subunit (LigB family)
VQSLKNTVPKILKLGTPEAPRAIVVVTAHWSERKPKISSAKKHELYYDYYGFPSDAYELKYDAPGSPEVAQEVMQALETEKLHPVMDDSRGEHDFLFQKSLLFC